MSSRNDKNFLCTIKQFVGSLLFSIFSVLSIVFYCVVVLLFLPFSIQARHKVIRTFLRIYLWMLSFLCGIKYEVEGLENIPKDRVGVVMSKHQSTWETFYLPIVFPNPAIILKRELFLIPFFGWGLAASSPIAINRNNTSSAMQQIITKGKKCLTAGRWILVFPEGTRVAAGLVGNYRLGGARLAVATGYPVIPVAHNAGRFWPKRKFIKRPGTIKVVIGPIIETTGRTPEEVLALTKDWIESTVRRIDDKT